MAYHSSRIPTIEALSTHSRLWAIAIATFGVGDLLTTVAFLTAELNHEGNPLAVAAIDHFGLWVLIPWKFAVFAAFVGLYRLAPESTRVGVPLGLALFGSLLTGWNIYSSLTSARIVL